MTVYLVVKIILKQYRWQFLVFFMTLIVVVIATDQQSTRQQQQHCSKITSDPFHIFWEEKNKIKAHVNRQTVRDSTAQTDCRGHSLLNPFNYKYALKLQICFVYLNVMFCAGQYKFHTLQFSYGTMFDPALYVPASTVQQSVHIHVLMIQRRENEGRIIILSLIWLWKLQQKVNS